MTTASTLHQSHNVVLLHKNSENHAILTNNANISGNHCVSPSNSSATSNR